MVWQADCVNLCELYSAHRFTATLNYLNQHYAQYLHVTGSLLWSRLLKYGSTFTPACGTVGQLVQQS